MKCDSTTRSAAIHNIIATPSEHVEDGVEDGVEFGGFPKNLNGGGATWRPITALLLLGLKKGNGEFHDWKAVQQISAVIKMAAES